MIPLPFVLPGWIVAIGKFLRAVPWQLWLFIAFVLAFKLYGDHRESVGVNSERRKWVAMQEEANRASIAKQIADASKSQQVNQSTTWDAANATIETRTQTAAAVERVRHVPIPVPAGCPSGLPDVVRDEGRAAVERARAAGNSVRAGENAGRPGLAR